MKKKVIIITILLVLLSSVSVLSYLFLRKKYKNCTIELGTKEISIANFSMYSMYDSKSKIITPLEDIDLDKVGNYDVVIEYLGKRETVTLNIQDTTAPKVEFKDLVITPGSNFTPNDFIVSMEDLQDMQVSMEANNVDTSVYKDYDITVKVADLSGNITESTRKLTINWLFDNVEIEAGDTKIREKILVDPIRDKNKISNEELAKVKYNDVGTYNIKAISEGKEYPITVKVKDTTKPTLKLKNVSIYLDTNAKVVKDSFITSVSDNSKKVTTTLKSNIDLNKVGEQKIVIEAVDPSGNKTTKEAVLTIKRDTIPPTIYGVGDLIVNKHTKVDFLKGVSSIDSVDGNCEVQVDSSRVNTDKAGTYYATYTSKDKKNNLTTYKRKIVVNHDQEDTNELARKFASIAPSDPLELSRYIRDKIKYAYVWGDGDPVWYALTQYRGNCYVHANLYLKIAQLKGYTVRLVNNTDKSHYWVMIYLNGVWKHVDPTPTNKDGLMNDSEMLTNKALNGVPWDANSYPKAE